MQEAVSTAAGDPVPGDRIVIPDEGLSGHITNIFRDDAGEIRSLVIRLDEAIEGKSWYSVAITRAELAPHRPH